MSDFCGSVNLHVVGVGHRVDILIPVSLVFGNVMSKGRYYCIIVSLRFAVSLVMICCVVSCLTPMITHAAAINLVTNCCPLSVSSVASAP